MSSSKRTIDDVTFEAVAVSHKSKKIKDTRSFYLELTEDGRPIKLGDGSFGAVFAARNSNDERMAVKVFYDIFSSPNKLGQEPLTQSKGNRKQTAASARSSEPALDAEREMALNRFRSEMRATATIMQKLGPDASKLTGLVLPVASTENFQLSDAGKFLLEEFRNSSLHISNYAMIMERYDCTLKNLLEGYRPGNPRAADSALKDKAIGRGYDVLRKLSEEKRETFIAWVIRNILEGLKILHKADLRHHDIKPANLLLRTTEGGGLEVALSDLGFLTQHVAFTSADTAVRQLEGGLPLGTRHYRSVEQRDYFDVCEVNVNPDDSYPLTTEDPKFCDSLMEKEDILIFCKDKSQTRFTVEDIKFDGKLTKIKVRQIDLLRRDARTQIILYKQQTARTDIFGIGSLIYDMLTSGRSPERFYDFIRRYDRDIGKESREDTKSSFLSIGALTSEYQQRYFTKVHGASAEVSSIFDELVYDRGKYPSPQMVSIIFKCMLTQAEGSYTYRIIESKNYDELYAALAKDLEAIGAIDGYNSASNNPVWRGSEPKDGSPVDDENIEQQLTKIQQIGDGKKRLAEAYVFVNPIFSLLLTLAKQKQDDTTQVTEEPVKPAPELLAGMTKVHFYVDMSPKNIKFSQSPNGTVASTKASIFKTRSEFINALRDNVLGLVTNSVGKPFMPIYMTSMVRKISLIPVTPPIPNANVALPKEGPINIQYLDASPLWFGFRKDDYLLLQRSDGSQSELLPLGETTKPVVPGSAFGKKATLVKFIHPIEYYLAVLGIYIQHCFFVDQQNDYGEPPRIMYLLLEFSAMSKKEMEKCIDPSMLSVWQKVQPDTVHKKMLDYVNADSLEKISTREKSEKQIQDSKIAFKKPVTLTNPIQYCFDNLTTFYVWLVGIFFRRLEKPLPTNECIPLVKKIWEKLGDDIAYACERGHRHKLEEPDLKAKHVSTPTVGSSPATLAQLSETIARGFLA